MTSKIDTTVARTCGICGVFKEPSLFKKPGRCIECVREMQRLSHEKRTGRKVTPLKPWIGDCRECNTCGEVKHREEFRMVSVKGRKVPFARCRSCRNKRQRERLGTPEGKTKTRKDALEYYHADKRNIRSKRIFHEYGITLEQKEEMIRQNKGKCPICGTTDPKRYWVIDHCHKSGEVRGVICDACNKALGFMQDSISNLMSGAEYLSRHYMNQEPVEGVEGVPMPDWLAELEEEAA